MIRIEIDLANPGQFFGCCGVYELAQRLWPQARARFDGHRFELLHGELAALVHAAASATLTSLDEADKSASPLLLGPPFGLRLDWWKDRHSGGSTMKPWAGTMLAARIAQAMQRDLPRTLEAGFFDDGHVVIGADDKKVEPFYFDARRGSNALPLDLGFSPDKLSMPSVAYPATEFFTLVGLQRFRPAVLRPRVFSYRAWRAELPIALAALVVAGALPDDGPAFQFENAFRTDQRKHKAFTAAIPSKGA